MKLKEFVPDHRTRLHGDHSRQGALTQLYSLGAEEPPMPCVGFWDYPAQVSRIYSQKYPVSSHLLASSKISMCAPAPVS